MNRILSNFLGEFIKYPITSNISRLFCIFTDIQRLTVTRYDYFCRLRIYDGGFRNSFIIFVAKPKKQQEKIYSAMTTDELIRFVQSMHCELVKRIDADAIIIGFQGGYFPFVKRKTGQNIQLYYKDFYACSL